LRASLHDLIQVDNDGLTLLIAQMFAQQHCGSTPAPAVVARVIAIVAARMTAMISFLINLTSFAAQPALARGKPETNGR